MIAKVSSAKAKPNGVVWIVPGQEAKFLAPLDVRDIPGVGNVTEQILHGLGIHKVGDLARFDDSFLLEHFANGDWLWLAKRAGKMQEDGSIRNSAADADAKSISHEHTYNEDIADPGQMESTLATLRDGRPPPARQ